MEIMDIGTEVPSNLIFNLNREAKEKQRLGESVINGTIVMM